jgi:hypothetical protein
MGRIVDLCCEIATAAEEGPHGLVLPPEVWDRLRTDWSEEDIDDALGLVRDSLLQAELVDSADSLSAHLLELLGSYGEAAGFHQVESGGAVLTVDVVGQLARRVARLEEVLEGYREGAPPDRRGFDALQRRLADVGIEEEMGRLSEEEPGGPVHDGEDDES